MSNTCDQSSHFTIRGYWQTHGKSPKRLDNHHTTFEGQALLPAARPKLQDRRRVPILTTRTLGFKEHKTTLIRGLRVSNDEALMILGQMISRRLKASAAQYFPLLL